MKFLLLFLFCLNAHALDLRDYFITEYTVNLNAANGNKQSQYTFFKNNAGLLNVYNSLLNINKAGEPFYWRKEYWINNQWCTATFAIMFSGDDKNIYEAGDWLASTPCTPNTTLGYRSNGVPTGLVWSLDETISEMNVWRQNTPSSAYAYSGNQAYSKTGLVKHLETFTPKFGRLNGVWAEGNGTTYTDVVHMVLYHGTRKDTNQVTVRCNAPLIADGAYYQSFKNYNSYAIELWLAKGVGIVQERTTFIEDGSYFGTPNCTGYIYNTAFEWYKDEQ